MNAWELDAILRCHLWIKGKPRESKGRKARGAKIGCNVDRKTKLVMNKGPDRRKFPRVSVTIEAEVQRRTARNIGTVFMTAAWWGVIRFDFFDLPAGFINFLSPATSVLLILTSVWVAYRLVDILASR